MDDGWTSLYGFSPAHARIMSKPATFSDHLVSFKCSAYSDLETSSGRFTAGLLAKSSASSSADPACKAARASWAEGADPPDFCRERRPILMSDGSGCFCKRASKSLSWGFFISSIMAPRAALPPKARQSSATTSRAVSRIFLLE